MKAKDKIKKGAADTGGIRKGNPLKGRVKGNRVKNGGIAGNWMRRRKGKQNG